MRPATMHPLAVVAVALLGLPLVALVVRAPWAGLPAALAAADVRTALVLSLLTATAAAALAVVVGVPLGWVLARDQRWAAVRPLVVAPLVLPPVVLGAGLHHLLGGEALLGLDLSGGAVAVVLAQVVVALPFVALAVETAVRRIDPRMEETALLHGMTSGAVVRRITLPAAGPGIAAGAALAWARALGELGATITFAGTATGREVLPALVVDRLDADPATAAVAGLLMAAVAIAVVVVLRDRVAIGPRPALAADVSRAGVGEPRT